MEKGLRDESNIRLKIFNQMKLLFPLIYLIIQAKI